MVITVDSNFAADKETVQTFLTGLSSVQSDFNGKIKPEHDTIRGISCESWPDVVGQSFKARIKELSDNEFQALENDISGGSFQNMKTNASNLVEALQSCIDYKAAIENELLVQKYMTYEEKVETKKATATTKAEYKTVTKHRQPEYDNAIKAEAEARKNLDAAVETCNTLIGKFPSFHFSGSASGDSGAGDAAAQSGCAYDGKYYEATDGHPIEGDIVIITLPDGTQVAAYYVQFDNYSGPRPGQITYLFKTADGKSMRLDSLNTVKKAKEV